MMPHGYISAKVGNAVVANPKWFPGRLRELRELAGLTQKQLADRAGVKRDAVARWESGRREPAWSSILALCTALGVSCEAFTEQPAERPAVAPGRPRNVRPGTTAPQSWTAGRPQRKRQKRGEKRTK
jgi:transcriptional regulator with XRE-family HTH domain